MSAISEFFEVNGYYHARGVFSPEMIDDLRTEFDYIVAQLSASGEDIDATWTGPEMDKLGAAETQVLHTHNVQQFSALWHRALLDNAFLDIAQECLSEDIVLHHSKLFQKPAGTGSPFPMHQDWSYFPTVKDSMIAAIIHVSDATDEMGCLRVYPGSHKLGRAQHSSGQEASEMLQRYPIEGATVLEAEAGDVVFFHYFTLHGSPPNRSDKVRKTVLVQMYAGDDRVEAGNQHPDERLALRGRNHQMSRSRAGDSKY